MTENLANTEDFQDVDIFFEHTPGENENIFEREEKIGFDNILEHEERVDVFFNNIPECEEDFTFLQDQNSFGAARLLCQESTSSSNNEEWKNDSSIQSIITESTEAENDMKLMNKWIISTNNKQLQMKILNLMVSALQILNSENNDQTNITNVTNTEIMPIELSPSLFTIKTIFKLYKIQINNSPEECSQIGFNLTENLKKTRKEFINNKLPLESPNSLNEYQLALPKSIYSLFEGMISNLLEYDKKKANEKQLIRKKPTKPLNKIKIKKISTFLTSVIVSLAQKKVKIWLPTILSSLCRKPRLLSSLHQVLHDSTIQLNEQTYLFGPNQFANETLIGFSLLINQLLNCKQTENNSIEYSYEFDSDIVNSKIIEQINIGIQYLPPHIVILEVGGNPSSDEEIFAACEKQEILQAEPINTKGRKAKEIVVSKVKDIKKAEKEADKTEKKQKIASKLSEKRSLVFTQQESNNSILPENLSFSLEGSQSISDQIITNIEHVSEPSSKKQKTARHLTTQQEKDLLATLMTPNSPTEEEVEEVLKGLLQFWDGWTKKKVRDYWSHHKPKS
ncbi:unnamed protein product [Rhizophagus irregularis]|nr:unnamed protein product [Rhizophagus irregularis]